MTPLVSNRSLPLSVLQPVGTKLVREKAAELGPGAVTSSQLRTFPDGVSTLQEFADSAIFYHPAYGAVSIDNTIYQKWSSASPTSARTAGGQILRDYLGFPIADSFKTVEAGGTAAYFERGMIVVRGNRQAYVLSGPIYEHYRRLGDMPTPTISPSSVCRHQMNR